MTTAATTTTSRNMVFVSHANPEDNEFTEWLSLRLAREGYPVWCDLTKLLGGETFWEDIEVALRDRTVKFLFVLSRSSNEKAGARNELDLALGLERKNKDNKAFKDFVIPLRVDDLPFDEINIQIRRKGAIDFSKGWACGFTQLLKKLAEDVVGRDQRFGAQAVTEWWHRARAGEDLVRATPESHASNWFPVGKLPEALYLHELKGPLDGGSAWTLKQPAHRVGDYIVSFAPGSDLGGLVARSTQLLTTHALDPRAGGFPLPYRERRNSVIHILRLAWDRAMKQRGMPLYDLARSRAAAYFLPSMFTTPLVPYTLPDGLTGGRALTGYKTIGGGTDQETRRYWHYALSADAVLHPDPVIVLKAHVLFSTDGKTLLDSPKRMHSARRGQCKGWWNHHWRDRMLGAVAWLAGDKDGITLSLGTGSDVQMSKAPIMFESPVSYGDDGGRHADDNETAFDDEAAAVGLEDGDPDHDQPEEA